MVPEGCGGRPQPDERSQLTITGPTEGLSATVTVSCLWSRVDTDLKKKENTNQTNQSKSYHKKRLSFNILTLLIFTQEGKCDCFSLLLERYSWWHAFHWYEELAASLATSNDAVWLLWVMNTTLCSKCYRRLQIKRCKHGTFSSCLFQKLLTAWKK